MFMNRVSYGLVRGRNVFMSVAPGPEALFSLKVAKIVGRTVLAAKLGWRIFYERKEVSTIVGNHLSRHLMAVAGKKRASKWFRRTLRRVGDSKLHPTHGLDAVTRTWYHESDKSTHDERIVRDLTIMYHDAFKAGQLVKEGTYHICSFFLSIDKDVTICVHLIKDSSSVRTNSY